MQSRFRIKIYSREDQILAYALFALVDTIWLTRTDSLFPVKQASQAQRGSSSASAASLYSDARAHSVGDPLTIIIAENTTAQSTAATKTAQDENVSLYGGTGLLQRLFRDLTLSASNSRSANGT